MFSYCAVFDFNNPFESEEFDDDAGEGGGLQQAQRAG
jgi:hypothetical protein